jgi:uncharacterized protein (DUF1501 family)
MCGNFNSPKILELLMSHLQISRRKLIRLSFAGGLLGMGALSQLSPRSLLAQNQSIGQPTKDRYFVICMFDGGWDTLLSLDPRDPQIFTDQAAIDTKITLGYQRLNDIPNLQLPSISGVYLPNRLTQVGPNTPTAMGAYMGDLCKSPYVDQIAIIRGINMSTLAHDVGKVRVRTGRPPSGNQPRGSSIATWLAHHYQKAELIPNLSIGEEVYNLDQPLDFDVFEVNTPMDLSTALTQTSMNARLSAGTLNNIEQLIDSAYPCRQDDQNSSFTTSSKLSVDRVRQLLSLGMGEQLNLASQNEQMQALRSRFGFDTSTQGLQSPAAKAALASKAITSGLSRVVSVNLVGSLDTHYGYGDGQNWLRQGIRQYAGWQAIARLMDELKNTPVLDGSGENFLDRTTIVAYSDFGRTAMLNPAGGRDHWLTTSYFLAGADIAGGKVFGASSDTGMTPTLVDVNTGMISSTMGEELRPEHIWQTLLYAGGIDPNIDPVDLRVKPIIPLLRG